MRKIIIPFFSIFLSFVSTQAQTTSKKNQDVTQTSPAIQKVIDNYIAALGGKTALQNVQSTIIENTMLLQGTEINMTTKKMGNKFKSVQSAMGKEVIQIFDGEKGYIDQMGAKSDFPSGVIADLKKGRTIDALGYDAANFKEVMLQKDNESKYYVLVSDKGKYFFDAKTGLLQKWNSKAGETVIKSYMTVDGISFPAEIETQMGAQKAQIKTTKITINAGVSDQDFK